jgi:hypothetical protein
MRMRSEYSDSDDRIADSVDEGTLKAVNTMQTLYSVFLPPHLCAQVMPGKIVSYQIATVPDETQWGN